MYFHPSDNTSCRLILVYHQLPSSKNKLTTAFFLKPFLELLENVLNFPGKLMIAGDFNMHVDDTADSQAKNFMDVSNSLGLCQRTVGSTHRAGHTLDLVISRAVDQLRPKVTICDSGLSDHLAVHFKLALPKPTQMKKPSLSERLRTSILTNSSVMLHNHP